MNEVSTFFKNMNEEAKRRILAKAFNEYRKDQRVMYNVPETSFQQPPTLIAIDSLTGTHLQQMKCSISSCDQWAQQYPYFCDQHGPKIYDVYIASSKLSDKAGCGLFAGVTMEAGDFVAWYGGEYLTVDEYKERYPTGDSVYAMYTVLGKKNPLLAIIDGRGTQFSGLGRYCNDPCFGVEPNSEEWNKRKKLCNAEFKTFENPAGYLSVIVETIRPIEKDEEILLSYGASYHTKHVLQKEVE